jgi:CheY-like chemotaxis protein
MMTPSSTPAGDTDRGMMILIAEDDADIREALRELLSEEGYRVLTTANGAEALRLFPRLTPPGLVLLDLMMPVLSGWQFLERVNAAPAAGKIPIVVLSASPVLEWPRGAVRVLRKPVALADLLAAVGEHCGG